MKKRAFYVCCVYRYFLFLQLRRDLHHGRLLCTPADANWLAACIIQCKYWKVLENDQRNFCRDLCHRFDKN